MNKEFDFNDMGKQMPYRTPEGFFEKMQKETMARVEAQKNKKKFYRLKVGIAAVLSAAAMWFGATFLFHEPFDMENAMDLSEWMAETDCDDPLCIYIQQLSDEELEEWIEFSDNDIFMYEDE